MRKSLLKRCLPVVILTALLMVICMLCGCNEKTSIENVDSADPYISIEGEEETGLVYHKKSKTVYILFSEEDGYRGFGYCSLYVQNGHFCEYRDGEIVEIYGSQSTTNKSLNEQTLDEIWSSMTDDEKAEILKDK